MYAISYTKHRHGCFFLFLKRIVYYNPYYTGMVLIWKNLKENVYYKSYYTIFYNKYTDCNVIGGNVQI